MHWTGQREKSRSQLKAHSKFHAMQFQHFGSKGILQLCLRFDLCNPRTDSTMFTTFLSAYEKQLNSADHKEAQKKSEQRVDGYVRLSKRIFEIRRKLKRGERLQHDVNTGRQRYSDLSDDEQEMVDLVAQGHYDPSQGKFVSSLEKQLKRLQAEQDPNRYTSAGSAAATSAQQGLHAKSQPYKPTPKSFNVPSKHKKGKGKDKTTK